MHKLSIHLVAWNGSKYIEYLFDSLKKQTYQDFKLIILDNASSDDTVPKIKHELESVPFEFELIENKENRGFAGGHNQLLEETRNKKQETNEYFLIINQDLYLMLDCIEKMVKLMDEHNDVAALAPRTMKWNFGDGVVLEYPPRGGQGGVGSSFTNIIDSLGLKVFRNRRVVEIGEGEDISNFQFPISNFQEVFGVSGAIVMFRRSAIDEIGFLDESFQSYKEDVDLAYRINSAGWKSAILYDAVTYHDRSGAGVKDKSDLASLKNKQTQKPWVRYHSYKNHLMTLIKNEYWQNYLLDLPWIKWYEFKKFIYFLLFEPRVLKGLGEIWRMRKDLRIKRLKIKKLKKVSWKEMRKWWR